MIKNKNNKMENNNPQGQINIELDEHIAEGIYSNLAIINHSNSEFVVDFVTLMPGVPKAKVKSRIILTPQHAKRFLKAGAKGFVSKEAPLEEIVKAVTQILNDKRFIFDCDNDQKWLFLGLILLAGTTQNSVSSDENYLKNRLNLPENTQKIKSPRQIASGFQTN